MARTGVNIIIENRKVLENGGRYFSAVSVFLHVVVLLLVILGVLIGRRNAMMQPKVYRVSIATLATGENPNLKTTPQKPKVVEAAAPEIKPVVKKVPAPPKKQDRKTKQTVTKEKAVGIDIHKTKKETPKPVKEEPEDVSTGHSANASTGETRIGFGGHASVVDLDSANFEYSYYLSIVQDRIGTNWVRTYVGKGKVKVYFRIKRDGSIVSAMIEESSGDVGLDRLALRAVTASDPLPPLPEGYVGNVLGIHIWFNYEE